MEQGGREEVVFVGQMVIDFADAETAGDFGHEAVEEHVDLGLGLEHLPHDFEVLGVPRRPLAGIPSFTPSLHYSRSQKTRRLK